MFTTTNLKKVVGTSPTIILIFLKMVELLIINDGNQNNSCLMNCQDKILDFNKNNLKSLTSFLNATNSNLNISREQL